MMKRIYCCLVVIGMLLGVVHAETVLFATSTNYISTGEAIEGAYKIVLSTNVQEIADLMISARTDSTNHQINADSGSLGINDKTTASDQAARFETGEKLVISFSKDVEITQFDFRFFDAGESFAIAASNQADFIIEYDALSDKGSDFINTNLIVTAQTEISLYANTSGNIGLEGFEVSVLGSSGDLFLTLEASDSMMLVSADFSGVGSGSYVLQTSTNLASNVWNTVSGEFNTDTNMNFNTTYDVQYFRAIAP